jgi:hypothetical protein
MLCKGIACTRSFEGGITSAKGQKLELLEWTGMDLYKHYENLVNPLCSKVMLVFYLTQALFMYILQSLLTGVFVPDKHISQV